MLAKIMEISTLVGTPMTYVLIHIWPSLAAQKRSEEPSGDNAFVMDLVQTEQRMVQDSRGRYKRLDGVFVHPDRATGDEEWEQETFKLNVPEEIKRNIEDYLARRIERTGTKDSYPDFHARPALVRSKDDPRGILGMSDVQVLVGSEVTVK